MTRKQVTSKPGRRHPLLMYRRTMERLWGITILLGVVMFSMWWFGTSFTQFYHFGVFDTLVLIGAILSLSIGGFAFFARFFGYVQACDDHLLIATPFIHLKTSYRRLKGVRSIEFYRIYSPADLSWAQRNYLDPFFGETAVVVNLKSYPIPPPLLKLFFPNQMLFPNSTGFVLLVPEWMDLSMELDSRFGAWQQNRGSRRRVPGFRRGLYRKY